MSGENAPPAKKVDSKKTDAKVAKKKDDGRLPHTKLMPAPIADLCLVKYRVSTTSPECQAYFDQGLGYFYSYVWMEAARSFETAAKHDPDCAMAWWGLSKACEKWGRAAYAAAAQEGPGADAHAKNASNGSSRPGSKRKGLIDAISRSQIAARKRPRRSTNC